MDSFLRSLGDVFTTAASSVCTVPVIDVDDEATQQSENERLGGITIGRRIQPEHAASSSHPTLQIRINTTLTASISGRSVQFQVFFKRISDETDLGELSKICRAVPESHTDEMRRSRLSCARISRTRLEPSTIPGAGRGLFATRDIAEDELITLYPGDVVLCWPDADHAESPTVLLGAGTKSSFASDPFDFTCDAWLYGVHTTATRAICGDPAQDGDPAYFGHFANDAARCDRAGTAGEIYASESELRANAALDSWSMGDCHLALVACKAIVANEEIFMSYGAEFWLEKLARPPSRWNFPDGSTYLGEGCTGFMDMTVRMCTCPCLHARDHAPELALLASQSASPFPPMISHAACPTCHLQGEGELTLANGSRYVGGFADGKYEGPGTLFGVDGCAEVWRFEGGKGVGEGILWTANRTEAWRMRVAGAALDDDVGAGETEGVEGTVQHGEHMVAITRFAVTLARAEFMTARLGLPVPRRTVFDFPLVPGGEVSDEAPCHWIPLDHNTGALQL